MTARRDALSETPLRLGGHVAGRFVEPTGEEIAVVDPSNERHIAILHESTAEEVDRAVLAGRESVELLTGGRHHAGLNAGCYVEPTAMLAPDNGLEICQEEIFGPFRHVANLRRRGRRSSPARRGSFHAWA